MFEENGVYKALKLTGYTNHRRGFVQARGLAIDVGVCMPEG